MLKRLIITGFLLELFQQLALLLLLLPCKINCILSIENDIESIILNPIEFFRVTFLILFFF